ncbi:hypothetical protein JWG42_10415 [Desulfoprunum benzoelyticum]|uniref:SOS-response transcriptional repressor LexA n=1 Tax=Desulfoprunum benzoelyticum TaxID=1506996 RepID=A0A840V7W0_9BACT|nr:S24 family peptidase [Desulfoprunum benzoelyticum]MBB5349071.1 SOS-response transcriptional repressor LexA [Desulfoprunum benzoelyticum]MBM9530560.1 hypothetical protein [Desulfoprunum benzoelyticum]
MTKYAPSDYKTPNIPPKIRSEGQRLGNLYPARTAERRPGFFWAENCCKMVPVISWVQAGDWHEVDDPYPPGYAEQWVQTFETNHPNAFVLTVVGHSMQPEFTKGDIIIIDPGLEPVSGDYVIARNREDATFKQLIRDGASVLLKPANDRYPIKDITGQPVKIVGVVVGKQKQYR